MGPLLDASEEGIVALCCAFFLPQSFFALQFAKTGNPNGNNTLSHALSSDPVWGPYGSAALDNVAILNLTAGGAVNVTMASHVRSAFCSFWAANDIPEVRRV